MSNEAIGQNINGRELCDHQYRTPIIFHTHPLNTYSYPSIEDINKVSKRLNYSCSIIASQWGIWQVYRLPGITKTIDIMEPKNHEKIIPYIRDLHYKTKLASNVSKPYDETTIRYIHRNIDYINDNILGVYGTIIEITPWNKISKGLKIHI